ncbi:hypothetical protein BDV93DRAFT_565530 [Ceratobasidium sp. AG-I]|nr:hypothetical protein BDV93DRAFT_565530 [Ceratobasidium sp. AG-I]
MLGAPGIPCVVLSSSCVGVVFRVPIVAAGVKQRTGRGIRSRTPSPEPAAKNGILFLRV